MTGSISGVVFNDLNRDGTLDPGDPGIPGVVVVLYNNGVPIGTAVSDMNGNYSFTGLADGTYTVTEIPPPGFTPTTPTSVIVTISGGNSQAVNFGNAANTGVISGTVFLDLNNSGIYQPGDPGIPFVNISLTLGGLIIQSTNSDSNGNYSFTNLADGTYTVTETVLPGYTSTSSTTRTVTITGGNSVTGVNFGLAISADLSISKSVSPMVAFPGSQVIFTITATNPGLITIMDAAIVDAFDPNLLNPAWTVAYSSGASGPVSGAGNINVLVTLPFGGTATFTVTATVSSNIIFPSVTNTATLIPPAGVIVPDTSGLINSNFHNNNLADRAINKSVSPMVASPGSQVTFTLTATNLGPSSVTGAIITDTFDPNLLNPMWTISYMGGASGSFSGFGSINTTVNLPVGSTATFIVTATISPVVVSSSITNTANIMPPVGIVDPNLGNNTSTVSLAIIPRVRPTNLVIKKEICEPFRCGFGAYIIEVENLGPNTTTGAVTVIDNLPVELIPCVKRHNGWQISVNGQTVSATRNDPLSPGCRYPQLIIGAKIRKCVPKCTVISNSATLFYQNNTAINPTATTFTKI